MNEIVSGVIGFAVGVLLMSLKEDIKWLMDRRAYRCESSVECLEDDNAQTQHSLHQLWKEFHALRKEFEKKEENKNE